MLDVFILSMSLLQIGIEGRTGYWNPFWYKQGQVLISVLEKINVD